MIFREDTAILILGSLLILCSSFVHAAAQQPVGFDGLEKYLNQKMAGPEAIEVIKDHLRKSETTAPLDELVSWAKAGFPDLQKDGYWTTESISLKLSVVRSIHYYFSTSPPANKSARYLAILDELERDDYISYHLATTAHWFVDISALEAKALPLLQDKDANRRSTGVLLGETLVEHNRSWFARYEQLLRSDDSAHVRLTVLQSIIGLRRKDVAYIAFERLLNDENTRVRELAARGLLTAADRRVLTQDDLVTILPAMLKTSEPFVRIRIALIAARLTTDRVLRIREEKFTDEFVAGFIRSVRSREPTVSDTELPKLWLEWWTPLIPEYTVRLKLVH